MKKAKENSSVKITNFINKTTETSKKIVENVHKGVQDITSNVQKNTIDLSNNVQKGAIDLAEKVKNDNYQRRLKKYNPLFPEIYFSKSFHIPNMIIIVDDAVRKGIDVCEGAIGWISKTNNMEVLYLYDEAIQLSGLKFVPSAQCDDAYYIDNFDRKRFINVRTIFTKAQEEKIAELEYIACTLGAKSCLIEIREVSKINKVHKGKLNVNEDYKIKKIKASSDINISANLDSENMTNYYSKGTVYFEGNSQPQRPDLKWFKNDDTINKLIEMRCNGNNFIKSKMFELRGNSSAVMSSKIAAEIDKILSVPNLKISNSGNASLESQVQKENNSMFIFKIEF